MTPAELVRLTKIRDGLKAAFWQPDAWRWAAKFDQFILDAEHAQAAEDAALPEAAKQRSTSLNPLNPRESDYEGRSPILKGERQR